MFGILALGFLIGMTHALEADHLAAMAAISSDHTAQKRKMMLRGAFWGAGHSLTLFALGGVVIVFGFVLTDATAARSLARGFDPWSNHRICRHVV